MSAPESVAESIIRRWLGPPDWTRADGPGWHGTHDAIVDAIKAERERCAKVLEAMPCPPEIHRHDWDAYFVDPAARAIRSKA